MSELIRWSELPDDAARAGFLERFKECGCPPHEVDRSITPHKRNKTCH